MPTPRLGKVEMAIMDVLWRKGAISIREIHEEFPKKGPAYTSVQTMVYRLETKGAVRRLKKIGNAHIFEAAISRDAARGRLIDDLLALCGGTTQAVMSHLIQSGKLTLDDIKDAQKVLREQLKKER
jgi:predicted transcriptional regulator